MTFEKGILSDPFKKGAKVKTFAPFDFLMD
jgi:hypothetical protein